MTMDADRRASGMLCRTRGEPAGGTAAVVPRPPRGHDRERGR
ncbi:hypothetical protein [Actinomadura formosensis]|nr:hypothetical protein [Actinomadura formosensis]